MSENYDKINPFQEIDLLFGFDILDFSNFSQGIEITSHIYYLSTIKIINFEKIIGTRYNDYFSNKLTEIEISEGNDIINITEI